MITLALQIFLLLLSAYLVGCMLGCLLRRSFHASREVPTVVPDVVRTVPEPLPVSVPTAESARFQSALTGAPSGASPPAPRSSEPVVEVRARPRPLAPQPGEIGTAEIEIVPAPQPAAPAAPEPVPEPAPEPVAVVEPPPPPPVVEIEPEPVAVAPEVEPEIEPEPAPAPEPVVVEPEPQPEPVAVAPEPEPEPEPARSPGAAMIASYAAVAAAAAAASNGMAAEEPPASAAIEPEPEPEPVPEPAPVAEASVVETPPAAVSLPADDLKRIRGIERVVEGRLNGLGVRRFADIAAWTAADVARVNQALGWTGRIEEENWIEQAQILARGVDTEYSRRQRIGQTTMAAGVAAAAASAVASATALKSAGPDRFTRIIGIDAETEKALHAMGYARYSEIAHWTSAEIEKVEAALQRPGRVGLDNWVEQARVLARYAGESEARPARLIDAIREKREVANSDEPAPQRTDLAGLRSVRSQALRGEAPAPGGRVDDLKRVRGIGVLIEKRLNALGVVSYEQIANWTGADIDSISSQLDFKGRIERENWIEQARILASGGQTEFSRRVDRGEVDSSRES
jgi:predicted flap endonuclease-1-like 5' DNA nuclease